MGDDDYHAIACKPLKKSQDCGQNMVGSSLNQPICYICLLKRELKQWKSRYYWLNCPKPIRSLILSWTFCLLFQSSFCYLLSFGKPPLVLSKLPIQAKTGASVMDAFLLGFLRSHLSIQKKIPCYLKQGKLMIHNSIKITQRPQGFCFH